MRKIVIRTGDVDGFFSRAKDAARRADQAGNFDGKVAIAEKISAMETAKFFEQRAALGSTSTAQAAWDKVGADAAPADDNWTQ
jgi:hypothetical protein